MAVEGIPIQSLWGFIRWLPGALLRWYFTPEKMARLIYVDLQPRNEPAVVNLGEIASFSLYLHAINLSPFTVELDRASFRFWCGGAPLNSAILKKQVIAPGEIATLYIGESIPDGQANQIAKGHIGNPVALEGNIEFNCKVHSFAKVIGFLDGIQPRLLNANCRASA